MAGECGKMAVFCENVGMASRRMSVGRMGVFLELAAAGAQHQFGDEAGGIGDDSGGALYKEVAGVNINLQTVHCFILVFS